MMDWAVSPDGEQNDCIQRMLGNLLENNEFENEQVVTG
jgi:hypothetical protein